MNRRLFVLSALALGGCASVGAAPAGPPMPLAELEPLYSALAGRDGVTIQVRSGGCTAKGDIAFYVQRVGGTASVAFARRHVDTCRSLAAARAEIAFTWTELGLDPQSPVFVLNPLVAWTGP